MICVCACECECVHVCICLRTSVKIDLSIWAFFLIKSLVGRHVLSPPKNS